MNWEKLKFELGDKTYHLMGIPLKYRDDVYSDIHDKELSRKIFDYVRLYNHRPRKNFCIASASDQCTRLAILAMRQLLYARRGTAFYFSYGDFDTLLKYNPVVDSEFPSEKFLDFCNDTDLLVIDDFGDEDFPFGGKTEIANFKNLIKKRNNNLKTTFLLTHIEHEVFVKKYSEDFIEFIVDNFEICHVDKGLLDD